MNDRTIMADHTVGAQERQVAGLTVSAADTWDPDPGCALSLTDTLCDEIFAIWLQPDISLANEDAETAVFRDS